MDFGDFLGGAASALKGNIDLDLQTERDSKRDRAKMELEKEYAKQVVASTEQMGNEIVSYNKYGDVVRRRPMTQEEMRLRDASLGKAENDAKSAGLDVQKGEFDVANQDRVLESELASAAAARDANRATSARATAAQALDQKRFEYEVGDANIPKELQEGVDQAMEMIYFVGNDPVSTSKPRAQVLEAELQAAIEAGDKATIRRLVNQAKGELGRDYLRAKTDATTQRPSLGGSLPPANPAPPGG